MRAVGASEPRLEGGEKVSGRARYACDQRPPGLLYARVLRSPLPHARIARIDAARALGLAGVRAALSSENVPEIPWYGGESRLFDRTLRFVGDEVAAVAADAEDIAEDALRLLEVEYQPLPFTVDPEQGIAQPPEVEGRGDVEAGLRAAEVLVDATYATQAALHNALEPHACTATWDDGTLTVYESTQGVFAVRRQLAAALGLDEARVRVITRHMGGGFGAKQIAWKHSVIAALLAQRTGRPVQLALERSDENLAAGHRNATRQQVRLGARRDGRLTAIEVRIRVHAGAYTPGGEESDVAGAYHTLYRCANVRTEQVSVRTHTGPAVAFRAPGHAEACFALESAMDELARALGIDPVELRLRNYAERDQRQHKPYTAADSLKRCYQRVLEVSRFHDFQRNSVGTRKRGIGFAAHDWPGGAGHPVAEAIVERRDDDGAELRTGVQDIGTGTRTALAQIVAEELQLSVDRVNVVLGDTALGLRAPTSAGSATLASLGPAVQQAAREAKRGGSGRGARSPNREDRAIRTCGAQCVEVEVDTQTGEVSVLRVVAAHDCGRIVNPALVDSQVAGGILQALGYALTEERVIDAALGEVLNANLEQYHVPTVADLPEIVNATQSMPDEEANALGAKGIGEPPLIPTAAAVANAVFDAVGIRVRELPLTRAKLLR